jgi:hypothetical protein
LDIENRFTEGREIKLLLSRKELLTLRNHLKRYNYESETLWPVYNIRSENMPRQTHLQRNRILVAAVLEQLADGYACDPIIEGWRGDINKEAIAEAVNLSWNAFPLGEISMSDRKSIYP